MKNLDVTAFERTVIGTILAERVPRARAVAFGSRTTGRAQRFSDLDLLLIADPPITLAELGDLRHALMESDLPYSVDLVSSDLASLEFRAEAMASGIELG